MIGAVEWKCFSSRRMFAVVGETFVRRLKLINRETTGLIHSESTLKFANLLKADVYRAVGEQNTCLII